MPSEIVCVCLYDVTIIFSTNRIIPFIFFGNWCDILSFPHSSVGKDSACNAGDPGSIPVLGRSTGEGIGYSLQYSSAFLVFQLVKIPLAMQETWV